MFPVCHSVLCVNHLFTLIKISIIFMMRSIMAEAYYSLLLGFLHCEWKNGS